MADDDSKTAAEVRRLRLTIVAIALVVVIAGLGWFAFNRASDDGKQKGQDVVSCVKENLSSPTTRDC